MFRKFLVFVASSTLTLLLFLTVTVTGVVLTFTPSNVKAWLRDSDVYSSILDDVLKQSQTLTKQNSGGGSDAKNALDDTGIQDVAKQTITPKFIQSTVEQIIDGSMPWLEGRTPQPTFSIDLATIKANFADNIGTYAAKRFAALPACAAGTVTDSTDILTVACKPLGYDPTPDIQKAVNDLKTSSDFIADTKITAATMTVGEGTDKKPLYTKLNEAPRIYKWVRVAPIILGALSLMSAATIVFLSTERRRGMRRIAYSLYVTGGLLLLEAWTAAVTLNRAEQAVKNNASNSDGLQNTGIALLRQVQHSLGSVFYMFAGSFLVIAIAITVYLLATRQRPAKDSVDHTEPPKDETPEEPDAKPTKEATKKDDSDGSSDS